MITGIQQFATEGVKNISNIFSTYTTDMSKIAEMVYGVTDVVTKPGCSMIAEEWESYDELLRTRKDLRQGWYIVRRDETSLITSLGEVVYHKMLFKNVSTGESCYLLDQLMGLEHHARITEDAEARILKEASESSYRKSGANASINGDCISKEAVMNKLHRLDFPAVKADEKKALKSIYIDADEDHVSLQYPEHKGDIRKPRINTVMPGIIYVYEGVDKDEKAKEYILGNWSGIMLSIKSKDTNVRCSAEGHVSHVYADRMSSMSSRPLGWCRTGADKMSRLRIYRHNQGDMPELVRFQKKELKQVAGAEEVIYSTTEMLRMEKRSRKKLGALADLPVYSIPYTQVKKIAAIKNHIWGL